MDEAEAYAALAVVRIKLPTGVEISGKPLGWRKAVEYMELLAKYDGNWELPPEKRQSSDILATTTLHKIAKEFPVLLDIRPREALDALSFSELIGVVRAFCIHQRGACALVETTGPQRAEPPAAAPAATQGPTSA
jgi:hypothetical protein